MCVCGVHVCACVCGVCGVCVHVCVWCVCACVCVWCVCVCTLAPASVLPACTIQQAITIYVYFALLIVSRGHKNYTESSFSFS